MGSVLMVVSGVTSSMGRSRCSPSSSSRASAIIATGSSIKASVSPMMSTMRGTSQSSGCASGGSSSLVAGVSAMLVSPSVSSSNRISCYCGSSGPSRRSSAVITTGGLVQTSVAATVYC